jgi:hypothetical protein
MSFLSKIKKSSETKDDTDELKGGSGVSPEVEVKVVSPVGYVVSAYSKKKAKKEKVQIKPSTRKTKKIDVFKDGKKVASIGGVRRNGTPYKDYPTYLKELGKEGAEKKRKAYLARHAKEPKSKDGEKTPSYYADVILW